MNIIMDYVYRLGPNLEYLLFLGFVFLAVAGAAAAIGLAVGQRDVMTERLRRLLGVSRILERTRPRLLEEEADGLVAKVTRPLHTMAEPDTEEARSSLRKKLIQAGLRSRTAYRNFLAVKIILAILLPAIYLARSSYVGLSVNTLMVASLMAAVGLFGPDRFVSYLGHRRKQGLVRTLPDALDLMVICVQAGLGLDMTFKRVGEEIRPLNKDLSDEFHLTNLEISAGKTRDESFRNMIARTGVAEIRNLLNVLVQAGRFGTSVASALVTYTEDLRNKRQMLAEEKAAKAAVYLLLPLIGFIFPALIVVILGPAGIKIATVLLPALHHAPK